MPQKKDNLPINADVDLQNGGTITYANEVIAIIAGVAANEIDGVAGMCISGGFGDIIGKNRNITRGVKVEIGSEEAAVDLFTIIEYGKPIQKVASEVQENVRKAIESMTGLHVVRVDVHVQGVSFEKEKIAAQSSLEAAHNNPVLAEPAGDAAEAEAAAPCECDECAAEAAAPCECEAPSEEAAAPCECEECAAEAAAPCECGECAAEAAAPCECEECAAEAAAPCECEECAAEAAAPCECGECAPEAAAPCECGECAPEAAAPCECEAPSEEAAAPEAEAKKDDTPNDKKRRPRKRS